MVMFERPSNCCQFFLDIINCIDDHGCDDNATCTDENGSYVCVCDSGFTGDGFNCTGEIMLNRFSDVLEWSPLVTLDWFAIDECSCLVRIMIGLKIWVIQIFQAIDMEINFP